MKERIIVNISKEKFFKIMINTIADQYYYYKHKKLNVEEIRKGFNFDIIVGSGKNINRIGKIIILEYLYPDKYKMEYKSDTFHRISGCELIQLDECNTKVILENFEEKLKNGKSYSLYKYNPNDVIKKASLKTRFSINRMIKNSKNSDC